MASKQTTMIETIAKAVAEAMRLAIQAMAATTAERPQSMAGPKIGRPAMNQPTLNWKMEDKYSKLKTFGLEVNNILSMYNTPQTEQLAIVKNWLGRGHLQLLQMLTKDEKSHVEHWKASLKHLPARPQFNETAKSLQFCQLSRKG